MFFRKKKRTQEPWPAWVKWAVIAFLGLSFFNSMHNKNAPGSAENLNLSKLLPIDSYKNTVFPHNMLKSRDDSTATLSGIKDVSVGEGSPAVCGQQVKITYESYAGDKLTDAGQSLAFRIGESKVMPALEQGVVGMKKGGKREIFSGIKHFKTELLEANPPIPDAEATPYRIAIVAAGNGSPIPCGQLGKFQVTLWSVDGKKLFSTKDENKPLVFTPGNSEVFLGLEQGIIGMRHGEMRTLVVSPAFQKTMNDNPSAVDFHLPNDQTVLVDVELMP